MLWIRGQSESFVNASKDIEGGGVNINKPSWLVLFPASVFPPTFTNCH